MKPDVKIKIKDIAEVKRVIELYSMTWDDEFEIEIGTNKKVIWKVMKK